MSVTKRTIVFRPQFGNIPLEAGKPVNISKLPKEAKDLLAEYQDEDVFLSPRELVHAIKEKKTHSSLLPPISQGARVKSFSLTAEEERLLTELKDKEEAVKEQRLRSDIQEAKKEKETFERELRKLINDRKAAKKERDKITKQKLAEAGFTKKGGRRRVHKTRKYKKKY